MSVEKGILITGTIIHCDGPYSVEVLENSFILVDDDGKILAVGPVKNLESIQKSLRITPKTTIALKKTQLLVPGLIDTHIHAPQYPNIGLGYDKPLLEWLSNYTYKLESQYRDQELCENVFTAIVRKTLDCGTTTACYFGSLFLNSTLVLVNAVKKYGQRALVGKINMITLAPDFYLETRENSIKDTLTFIDEVRSIGSPLIQPVITPRFALSADEDLMEKLGRIAKEQDLHIQTHISENKAEVDLVHTTFHSTDYASVYDVAGLLTNKTVLAHGVYLTDSELNLLKQRGTSIAHCPDSNTNLSSGLCDVIRLKEHGVTVGLGTDVAGGASPSIISAMKSALGVSTHISFNKENYSPLTYKDVFYLATLGGAKALALDEQIGNFVKGKSFDALIVDLNVNASSAHLLSEDYSPLELLQKFIYVGDDRNVAKVFVNGKIVK